MRRILATITVLLLLASIVMVLLASITAFAADDYVPPSSILSASSGNVAAATATATIAATPGYLNRICSFQITSSGSTGAAVVSPTVTGLAGGTATYTYTTVAGVTLANTPLLIKFAPCAPASAPNTAIIVSMPSLGAGNTNTTVTAHGYKLAWP